MTFDHSRDLETGPIYLFIAKVTLVHTGCRGRRMVRNGARICHVAHIRREEVVRKLPNS